MDRTATIVSERTRVAYFIAGSPALDTIEATKLDYQVSVLMAARHTEAFGLIDGASSTLYDTRQNITSSTPGFYDIYGSAYPSAVANSQLHYGTQTPVFIEDQPLVRGHAAELTAIKTLAALGSNAFKKLGRQFTVSSKPIPARSLPWTPDRKHRRTARHKRTHIPPASNHAILIA